MNNLMVQRHEYGVSEIERMANAFAASKLFGINNVEQAIALCFIAQAEGRHPASAAQDYHIIQGKPSKKADAMLRDFLANGGKVSDWTLTDTRVAATFSHPAGGAVTIDWDMARAKKAGIKNPMWDKYPRQMLRARVVSEGVRTVFPMATSGMYVPEEVVEFEPTRSQPQEVVTVDGEIVDAPSLPAPQSKAKSREPYRQLSAQIAACETLDQLAMLWKSPEAGAVFRSLPDDWKDQIAAEKDARKAVLFDSAAFLAALYNELSDAQSEAAINEVWDASQVEVTLSGHDDALTDAFTMKRDRLEALATVGDEADSEIPF